MTFSPVIIISTFAALVTITSALSCLPCEQLSCGSRPRGCQYGWVKDACGCCFVCGNGPGEACQGPFGILGRCGKGLKCQLPENESLPPEVAEGTCVKGTAFKPEPVKPVTDEKPNKETEWVFKPIGSNKPYKLDDFAYKPMSDAQKERPPAPNAGYRPAPMWYKPKPKENYNRLKPTYINGFGYTKPYKPYYPYKSKPTKAEKIKAEKSKSGGGGDASKPRSLYYV